MSDKVLEKELSYEMETKSSASIGDSDTRQLFNYLRASPLSVDLLLHFGPKPAYKRFVLTDKQLKSE